MPPSPVVVLVPTSVAPRDFDLIEIPFPDRGEPELIQNGARDRREAPEADPARAVKPA